MCLGKRFRDLRSHHVYATTANYNANIKVGGLPNCSTESIPSSTYLCFANEDNEQENGRPKLLAKESLVVDHLHANLVAENAAFPA
jgi:hypothetical protein